MQKATKIFSEKKENLKEYLFNKATSFLKKKRKSEKVDTEIENFDFSNSDNNDSNLFNDFFDDLFTHNKSFNNLILSSAETLSILPKEENKKNEPELNNISITATHQKPSSNDEILNFSKFRENTNSNTLINVKLEDILGPSINELKTLPNTSGNEEILKVENSEKDYIQNNIIKLDENEDEKENNIINNNTKDKLKNKEKKRKFRKRYK